MQKKGFTLIELLVVIAIIGILVTIVLVGFGNVRKDAADKAVQANINQMRLAAEIYYNANNTYEDVDTTDNNFMAALDKAEDSAYNSNCVVTFSADSMDICMHCQMNIDTAVTWCVDSQGFINEGTCADGLCS